jgi:hypothetical protein
VTLQVVGAGLGRTGTHTQKVVLEQLLGGQCHHMVELFANPDQVPLWSKAIDGAPLSEWGSVLDPYVAAVDWPAAHWYAELAEANPDALVLLSVRASADEWYRSASNTIFPAIAAVPPDDPWGMAVRKMLAADIGDPSDAETAKAGYERHNAEVRATIPKDRLLEWKATDGWAPLCERLGVPIPDEPFPVTNTTEEWQGRAGGAPPTS